MNIIEKSTLTLAQSCEGNPVTAIAVIMLFFLMFSILESTVEKIIFGKAFEHFLDPIFIMCLIGYSGYAVWFCAAYQIAKNRT